VRMARNYSALWPRHCKLGRSDRSGSSPRRQRDRSRALRPFTHLKTGEPTQQFRENGSSGKANNYYKLLLPSVALWRYQKRPRPLTSSCSDLLYRRKKSSRMLPLVLFLKLLSTPIRNVLRRSGVHPLAGVRSLSKSNLKRRPRRSRLAPPPERPGILPKRSRNGRPCRPSKRTFLMALSLPVRHHRSIGCPINFASGTPLPIRAKPAAG
jgi:hypothetical protein